MKIYNKFYDSLNNNGVVFIGLQKIFMITNKSVLIN